MTGRNDGSYIALRLDAVSSAGTTGTIGVPLDGSVPFSIDVWARFNGLAARTVLLGQNSRFWLGTIGEQVTAQFGNGPVVRSDPSRQPLRDDTWHYICVTWDGASLRLYIDGLFNVMQGATPQGIGPAGATVMGDGLQGLLRTVRVYNTVLDAAAVSANMFNPPPPVTIVAAFDFSQVPPIDTGPAHLPITLSNNATQYAVSPALTLSAIGYAQPLGDDEVNPGGAQVDPYTVQTWVYLNPMTAPQQAIFVNSDLQSDTGMALMIRWDAAAQNYRLVSQRGAGADTLTSTGTVPRAAWVNLAVTFDGATSRLYINGVADASRASPPIALYRPRSALFIGAALAQGLPTGATSLQGYIRGVDVWRRALTAAEIMTYMTTLPDLSDPDIAALYTFTSSPPRNHVTAHPVGLAEGAVLSGQLGPATASEPLPAAAVSEEFDDRVIAELAASVDFTALLVEHRASLDLARNHDIAEAADPAARARAETAWDAVVTAMAGGRSPGFFITTHVVNQRRLLIAHTRHGPRLLYAVDVADSTECDLWKVQLILIVVGGVLDAVFGVSVKATDQAIAFIRRSLNIPRIAATLALGSIMTAKGIYSIIQALADYGALRELVYMIVELGFWSLLRLVTKILLLAAGVGIADVLASLVATAATFILTYQRKPASCDPLPQVTLAAIKFNYDPTGTAYDALSIRKNFATDVAAPEWVKGKTAPQDAPAAYALSKIASGTVNIQAKFTISAVSGQAVQIRAIGGGLLGAIDPLTIGFGAGNVSAPEFITIALSHQTLAAAGVRREDITWTWQYSIGGGSWTTIGTSTHRIYVLLDVPSLPWVQTATVTDTQRPWTDVLDFACTWAAGATTADAAASAVTQHVYGSLGLRYDTTAGATAYEFDSASGWTFHATKFIELLNGGTGLGNIVNCTDCATIVTTFANALGCNNFASIMTSSGGFDCNKIIAIGRGPGWAYPFSATGPGHFSYHEVSWTNAGGLFDPLYDACLELDTGTNPWDWASPSVTHTPGLALKMTFCSPPAPPTLPLAAPFTAQTYRERLATNNANGIGACQPSGQRPNSQSGRPRVL